MRDTGKRHADAVEPTAFPGGDSRQPAATRPSVELVPQGGEEKDLVRFSEPQPRPPKRSLDAHTRHDPDEDRRVARLDGLIRALAVLLAVVILTTLAAVYSRSTLAFVAALGVNVGGLLYVRARYRLKDGTTARP